VNGVYGEGPYEGNFNSITFVVSFNLQAVQMSVGALRYIETIHAIVIHVKHQAVTVAMSFIV